MELQGELRKAAAALDERQLSAIAREFPPGKDGVTYLNTGSAGRKAASVLHALQEAHEQLNINPTVSLYYDDQPLDRARQAAAALLGVHPCSLLLLENATQGLQLIMQSFLQKPGDELVTTNREHGNAVAIMRFLEESRGIVVRRFDVPETATSEQLYLGLLSLVTERTRLVLVSEIDCLTGWMPDLSSLAESLEMLNVHLLVDGAHSPGHIIARPSRYPLWVGSGHKWLGAPNGTGFAYVARELIPFLEPTRVAQHFFDKRESEIYDLTRFECNGGNDMARWFGLAAAIALYESLHPEDLFSYQRQLVASLAERLFERFGRRVNIRTPIECNEYAGMLTFYFPDADVAVKDLRKALYDDYKIWIQPDFIGEKPGHGARISCHYSNTEAELGSLIEAIASYI